jgi:hypothetical protein
MALCLAVVLVTAGCSRESANSSAAPPKREAAQQPSAAPQTGQTITGTVVETMDAASYTYVRVKTDKGDVWAATAQFKVAVGDQVTVPLEMQQTDFRSPTLNRQFPVIYFASHIDRVGGETAPAMTPAHPSASAASPSAAAPQPATPVTPAEGGMTVADVWAKRGALAGKTVTVRGRVVKFNGGILDRNWVHIQDGTGDAKDGSNDLTITSQNGAKVGDIVTATGKVAVKKDFGAGYAYEVLLEGATIK